MVMTMGYAASGVMTGCATSLADNALSGLLWCIGGVMTMGCAASLADNALSGLLWCIGGVMTMGYAASLADNALSGLLCTPNSPERALFARIGHSPMPSDAFIFLYF